VTFLFIHLFIYLFFSGQHREETPGRILTRNGSKTRYRARMCLFGIIKWKIEIWTLFNLQNP